MRDIASKTPWNSLEVTRVVLGGLTPLLIFVLGFVVNQSIRSRDDVLTQAEQDRVRSEQRQNAVQSLSRFIYERRARAEMLASALRRNVSLEEIVERKKLYDDAYVRWSTDHQANLLLVRQLLEEKQYSKFEELLECHLVGNIFAPLDQCLTAAYDRRLGGAAGGATLEQCSARQLIQRALECGYALTDELFKLSGAATESGRAVATQVIVSRCDAPSNPPPQPTGAGPK
jgi:hypothetical protein